MARGSNYRHCRFRLLPSRQLTVEGVTGAISADLCKIGSQMARRPDRCDQALDRLLSPYGTATLLTRGWRGPDEPSQAEAMAGSANDRKNRAMEDAFLND